MHQIETLFENAVDRAFDRFEVYVLNNIFRVPHGITLNDHGSPSTVSLWLGLLERCLCVLNTSFKASDEAQFDEQIQLVQSKIRKVCQ